MLEADNTSDLSDLPRMLERFHEGNDVVLASVYAPGGRILGVAPWRLAASKAVSNVFRYTGGLRDIHTLSSLYRVYRAGTLRRAAETYGYLLVREPGFAANVELLLKLYNAGARVAEVPTVNDWSRRLGHLQDEHGAHDPRLRAPDGRPPRRAHPAAADFTSRQRGGRGARRRAAHRAALRDRGPRMTSPKSSPPRAHAREGGPRGTGGGPRGLTHAGRQDADDHRPRVGVVGAGILGTVLALRLAEGGARVTLLERAPTPGGLAGAIDFGGHRVDRFYHVIVPSDERMIGLAEELGLSDRLSFSPVGVGFFIDGEMHPFNGIGDFLRFSPLSPLGRARLAWFVLQCQLRRDYAPLEREPLQRWLTRHCGRRVVERIWRPLLDSRFNSNHDELPATYLWARTNRMRSARESGSSGERMGCLKGGHETLVLAAAERARELGVDVRLGAGVEGLVRDERGGIAGVRVDGHDEHFDLTIPTLQPPALRRLLPPELQPLLAAYPSRYLGVVCLILKLRRTLTPYYSINICDPTPITTVVETSHVVGTEHTDGLRLAYLPKYCDADSAEFAEDDETVYRRYTEMLAKLAPEFRHEDVVEWTVQRAPLVEPVHALGHEPRSAPIWPGVQGLALASASQIYPRLLNGESVVELAERVAGEALGTVTAAGHLGTAPAAAQALAA